jgi:hypothetical protein
MVSARAVAAPALGAVVLGAQVLGAPVLGARSVEDRIVAARLAGTRTLMPALMVAPGSPRQQASALALAIPPARPIASVGLRPRLEGQASPQAPAFLPPAQIASERLPLEEKRPRLEEQASPQVPAFPPPAQIASERPRPEEQALPQAPATLLWAAPALQQELPPKPAEARPEL